MSRSLRGDSDASSDRTNDEDRTDEKTERCVHPADSICGGSLHWTAHEDRGTVKWSGCGATGRPTFVLERRRIEDGDHRLRQGA